MVTDEMTVPDDEVIPPVVDEGLDFQDKPLEGVEVSTENGLII